jgi:ubiquitin-protein ligase
MSQVVIQNKQRVMRDIKIALEELPRDCGILVAPDENCMLLWHFLIPGAPDTPYYGGLYHGVVWLNQNHPLSAPSFYMITPSGRFHTSNWPFGPGKGDGNRICTSESSYHTESWSSCNSIASVIKSFAAFMADNGTGIGSLHDSVANRKKFAKNSLQLLQKDPVVIEYFPEVAVELREGTWKPPFSSAKTTTTISSDDKIAAKKKPAKKIPVVESESEEEVVSSDSEEEKPAKKATKTKKKLDCDSEDEKPVKKVSKTKKKMVVEDSESEEEIVSSDSEDEKPAKKRAKKPAKKPAKKSAKKIQSSSEEDSDSSEEDSDSSEEDSDSSEEEIIVKKKAPIKKTRGRAR